MKIEIVTTKRKLTKSVVKQMQAATHLKIKDAVDSAGVGMVIGYVTDCHKLAEKLAIIHHIDDYYTVPMHHWVKSSTNRRIVAKCDKTPALYFMISTQKKKLMKY